MKLFQKVAVSNGFNNYCRFGRVVGQASYPHPEMGDPSIRSNWIVLLEEGFYSKDGNTYVSTVLVDEDCLTVLE